MKKLTLSLLSFLTILSLTPKNTFKSYAETYLEMEERTIYETNFTLGGTSSIGINMINKYFDSKVTIVKENSLYFLSITLLDNNALSDFYIKTSEYESGIEEEVSFKKSIYTITLNEELLNSSLNVTAKVAAMDKDVSFTLKPNLSSLVNTLESVPETKEYKALYVPSLEMNNVGDISSLQNAVLSIPSIKAYFGEEEIDVETKVISPSLNEVEIIDNKFTLEELGEYEITYKASTPLYKTNLGNDSYTQETIKVISSSTSSSEVKINDKNNLLPSKYIVQSTRIESGTTYNEVKTLLKDISSNFEITNVQLLLENGEEISLQEEVEYEINTNPSYNRNKIKVYYLNGESLEEISSQSYGRYIKFSSSHVGTFIICEEGINHKINLPLIIILSIVGLLLLVGLIIFIIFFIHKRRRVNHI